MRIAVVYLATSREDALSECAKNFARGLEAQGHQVQTINARTDSDARLASFEYFVVGGEPKGLFAAKADPALGKFLASHGTPPGRKAFAFIRKRPFFSDKGVVNLMGALEGQGLIVDDFSVFRDPAAVKEFAATYQAG